MVARARDYLERHGRLTITAVTVFERLRGYRAALRLGKPFETRLRSFEALVANSIVLPLDRAAASSIRASTPFEPLPSAFSGPYIELRFIFLYNIPLNSQTAQ